MNVTQDPPMSAKRRQTARAIQREALDLAATLGYEAMTIDMIAERAGVSRRTFFNHYRHKHEALAGPKVDSFGPAFDWFVTSQRPIMEDLERLVRQNLTEAAPDRTAVRNIGKVLNDSPQLRPVFSAVIDNLAQELEPLLTRRLGPDQPMTAILIGRLIAHSIALSFQSWAVGGTADIEETAENAIECLRSVQQVLQSD